MYFLVCRRIKIFTYKYNFWCVGESKYLYINGGGEKAHECLIVYPVYKRLEKPLVA